MASKTAIILWCHPRSTSTMFERAFLTRPAEFRVLHEPLGDPWYFGCERASPRYSAEKCATEFSQHASLTIDKVWDDIQGNSSENFKTFSKDMAQYLFPPLNAAPTTPGLPERARGNPTFLPEASLLQPHIAHAFLIRTPEKAVPSYHRLCCGEESKVTGFEYFDPNEVGLKELRALYEFIASKSSTPPIIIDSQDLLNDPPSVMKTFCEHVGVDFQPSMLSWDSGSPEHFKKWPGFHTDAENSTRINKCSSKAAEGAKEHPAEVKQAIRDNMEDYQWLSERRLQI